MSARNRLRGSLRLLQGRYRSAARARAVGKAAASIVMQLLSIMGISGDSLIFSPGGCLGVSHRPHPRA